MNYHITSHQIDQLRLLFLCIYSPQPIKPTPVRPLCQVFTSTRRPFRSRWPTCSSFPPQCSRDPSTTTTRTPYSEVSPRKVRHFYTFISMVTLRIFWKHTAGIGDCGSVICLCDVLLLYKLQQVQCKKGWSLWYIYLHGYPLLMFWNHTADFWECGSFICLLDIHLLYKLQQGKYKKGRPFCIFISMVTLLMFWKHTADFEEYKLF